MARTEGVNENGVAGFFRILKFRESLQKLFKNYLTPQLCITPTKDIAAMFKENRQPDSKSMLLLNNTVEPHYNEVPRGWKTCSL